MIMAPALPIIVRDTRPYGQIRTPPNLKRMTLQHIPGQEDGKIENGSKKENDTGNISRIGVPGDLVLAVSNEDDPETFLFRVTSDQLIAASPYFRTLLDPRKFQEGTAVAKKLEELRRIYPNLAEVPFVELPQVQITHVGRISSVKNIKSLMTDFFQILHDWDMPPRRPPLVNIANLAVVADRFDATTPVSLWMKKRWIAGKPTSEMFVEESVRQRLLVGWLFGHDQWISSPSMQLLLSGSKRWIKLENDQTALWWDLPRGLEEELQFRRDAILETIGSLQNYVLAQFASKSQQCRLGYDSSPQCDSFQLGELVRFLTRTGTLSMQSVFGIPHEHDPFEGDVRTLIGKLRSCPSYQIDQNHSHCGARKLLLTGLDYIQDQIGETSIGICHHCWQDPSASPHFWSRNKAPLFFNNVASQRKVKQHLGSCPRQSAHEAARDFFMAADTNWESVLRYR